MNINNYTNLQYNLVYKSTNKQNRIDEVWNDFKRSKNVNEKRKLLNQMIALNNCEEDDDTSSCTSGNEKVIKDLNNKKKQESIASKVARGEYVTEKERNYLEANNPDLLKKSRYMNYDRKSLEQKIRNCKSKQEAKSLINNTRIMGLIVGGGEYNKVASSCIDKAEQNTRLYIKKREEQSNRKRIIIKRAVRKMHINRYV